MTDRRRKMPPGVRKRTTATGHVSYQARWRDSSGTQQAATFDTVSEAADWLAKMKAERSSGGRANVSDGRTLFAAWWATWMAGRRVRPATFARDTSYGNAHILPHWGTTGLRDIRPTAISAWVESLTAPDGAALAPATAAKHLQILSAALKAAVDDGLIATNPAANIHRPSIPQNEARFLTPAEAHDLEAAIDEHWRLIVPFGIDTGLRIGELAALRVRDLDLLRGTVAVTKTMSYVTRQVTGSDTYRQLGDPKSRRGTRVVPMLTDEVGERVADQIARRRLSPDSFLFTGPKGAPLQTGNFRRRVWNPAVSVAGLEGVTPHAMRHTAVAHWIAAGVDFYEVSRYIGHASITTTDKLYGHLLPQDTTAAREALSAMRRAGQEQAAAQRLGEEGNVVGLDQRRRS